MIDPDIGQEYLDHFDETLNLSKPPARRVGVQVMVDFYGTIMARVGVEALNFDDSITRQNIVKQWEAVTGKFRSLDEIDTPGDFHRIIRDLYHNLRNSTAHNFVYDPPKDILTESRFIAEEWRQWFLDAAETYNDSFGAYSTAEYEEMKRHMRDPLYAYDYVYVAVQLEMEVEHAVRNVLKSKGIAPMKYGLRGHCLVEE